MVGQLCWEGQEEVLLSWTRESETHPQTQRCFVENAVLGQLYLLSLVSPAMRHNLFLPHTYFRCTFPRAQKIAIFLTLYLIWYKLVKRNTEIWWCQNYLFSSQGCLGPCIALEWDAKVSSRAQILTGKEPKINHNCCWSKFLWKCFFFKLQYLWKMLTYAFRSRLEPAILARTRSRDHLFLLQGTSLQRPKMSEHWKEKKKPQQPEFSAVHKHRLKSVFESFTTAFSPSPRSQTGQNPHKIGAKTLIKHLLSCTCLLFYLYAPADWFREPRYCSLVSGLILTDFTD